MKLPKNRVVLVDDVVPSVVGIVFVVVVAVVVVAVVVVVVATEVAVGRELRAVANTEIRNAFRKCEIK